MQTVYFVVEHGIKLISSICILFGLWLIVGPMIVPVFRESLSSSSGRRITRMTQDVNRQMESENAFIQHISVLLESTNKQMGKFAVVNFLVLSFIMFALVAGVVFFVFRDLLISFCIALFAGGMPYLFKRLQLNKIRQQASLQLLDIMPNLLQHYQAENHDIYHALLRTMEELDPGTLRRVLQKLLNHMQLNRNRYRLKQKIDIFIYSIQGNIAKRLGRLIYNAYIDNTYIGSALVQLEKDARRAKKLMEFQKTQGFDTVMLGYAPIVTFPGSLILGYYASGPQDYFYYQFHTPLGLGLFITCVIASVLGIVVAILMSNPKADL